MSEEKSIHSAGIEEIHVMPISAINRPLPSLLDDKKVDSIVETLKVKYFYSNIALLVSNYLFCNFYSQNLKMFLQLMFCG